MDRQQITNEVLPLLNKFMRHAREASVTESTSLTKDLQIDSADMMDIVLALEERFSIQVSDEQLDGVKTVGDIVSLVGDLKAAA